MPVDVAGAIETARNAFQALEQRDWNAVARLTAPPVLKTTQTREIAVLLAWARFEATRDQTGATGWGSHGTYTPELLADHGSTRLDALEGAPTIAELAALEPFAFFVRWLSWGSEWVPKFVGRQTPGHVIGGVAERPDLVHVVYRGGPDFGPPPSVRSLPLIKLWAGWRLHESRDMRLWGGQMVHLMRFPSNGQPPPHHERPS